MTSKQQVIIPNKWDIRDYQEKAWKALTIDNYKRAVLVWHRRAGKDALSLNFAALKMVQEPGLYWYMAPEQTHIRKIVWDNINNYGQRIIDQAFPHALRKKKANETEMKIEFKNNSLIQFVGSDNYNSLVGANPKGVIFSEFSIANPRSWDFIRPILAENKGWAIFIYTPRGNNHGRSLYDMARNNPAWFSQLLTVEDTLHNGQRIISHEAIEEERKAGMSEDEIQQEFYCSFNAAIKGAYYNKLLNDAEREGRITSVAYDSNLMVNTAWDLGYNDPTAIWFFQQHYNTIRIIDYYENNKENLSYFVEYIKKKPYKYEYHILPHDVKVPELGSGQTRLETLKKLNLGNIEVPKVRKVEERINGVIMNLSRCYFDKEKCFKGLEALKSYQQDYDEDKKIFKSYPRHDWSSHAADAFGYLFQGLKEKRLSDYSDRPSQAFNNDVQIQVRNTRIRQSEIADTSCGYF